MITSGPSIADVASAYARASACFREAAVSSDPLPFVVDGMRAVCVGAELGNLSMPERAALSSAVTSANPCVSRALAARAPGAGLDADPERKVSQIMQTISLVIMWGTSEAELEWFGMGSIADQIAQLRISANLLESVARSAQPLIVHIPVCGSRH